MLVSSKNIQHFPLNVKRYYEKGVYLTMCKNTILEVIFGDADRFELLKPNYQQYIKELYAKHQKEIKIVCRNKNYFTNVITYPPFFEDHISHLSKKYIYDSEITNFLREDPIIDYYDFKLGIRKISQTSSPNDRKVISEIINQLPLYFCRIPIKSNALNTKIALDYSVPIIYNGSFLNAKHQYIVRPKLLMQTWALKKLSPTISSANQDYVPVVIQDKKLSLKVCGDLLKSETNTEVIKCRTSLTDPFIKNPSKIIYVIGNRNHFMKLGTVHYETKHFDRALNGIKWKRNISPNNIPYPNAKNSLDSPYTAEKTQYASKIKELTLLYCVGPTQRKLAHQKGIVSYDDPNLTSEILGVTGKNAVHLNDIIKGLQQQKEPIKSYSNSPISIPRYPVEFYVDFETSYSFSNEKTYPYFIGIGIYTNSTWSYQYIHIHNYQQLPIFCRKLKTLFEMFKHEYKLDILPCYHWSSVEPRIFNQILPKTTLPFHFIDLCKMCKDNRLVFKGMHSYSLKSIGKVMYNNKLTPYYWKTHVDNLGPHSTIDELIEYNHIDCIMMKEILRCVN